MRRLAPLTRRVAPKKRHLRSRPRNKAGILSFEKSSPDFRWKISFVLSGGSRIATASWGSSFPDKSLGDANDESEFIFIPKNAPPDASLRIRACETERSHATRQTSDVKCDADGEFWSVACRIRYFRPPGWRGRSQSRSASFARNCSPAPARTATRRLVRNYCQIRSRGREL